jgi:two-component system LytT family response regulator
LFHRRSLAANKARAAFGIADTMATIPAVAARNALRKFSTEPLSSAETLAAAALLFAAATVYCQLYCLVAYQQMHGASMPMSLSMQRAAVETVPALAAFELSKRALRHPSRLRKFTQMTIGFVFVAALTIAALRLLQSICHGSSMPVRSMVAECLPSLGFTAIATAWADQVRRPGAARDRFEEEASIAGMPPVERIDWVHAAGNYVEVHFGGRTRIIRMTLRQALESLGCDRFVQVHRSALVNRDRINALDQGRRISKVCLADGTVLKVGGTYRGRLFDK